MTMTANPPTVAELSGVPAVHSQPMDTTVADPLIGALVDGRYRVSARVARGGMATVYTAMDERLERTVALKIIHPGQSQDPRFVDRFTDEAKTIARLTHPNIVAVYDQGSFQGLPYLVMEYVRGRTLRELLADRQRLQPQEALAIMEQVLAAVAAAHRAGLVHRDVKPENVLVAEAPGGGHNLVDGVVKVADFGLARAVEASADESGNQLMATVAYVAPELVTDGHADPRTDVYSAGIVLFEMLTGQVPYEGERPVDVAWQHVDRDVPAPSRFVPGLSPVLDDLVARCTRRDPAGRPTDAGAMLQLVQSARETSTRPSLAQQTVIVPQVPAPYRPAPEQRPSWASVPQQTGRARQSRTSTSGAAALLARINANPRGRLALVAGLLALGLLIAIGGYWFGVGRYTDAPNLVNLTNANAAAEAKTDGFTLAYAPAQWSNTVPKDIVISQTPGAAGRILEGGTITLTLSKGPEIYQVPNEAGKSKDQAFQDLESLGLKPTEKDVYSDLVPQGNVTALDPAVGTNVKPGDSITVQVSKGPNPVTIPKLTGLTQDQAQAKLDALGVKAVFNQVDDATHPAGQVLSQDIPQGTGVTDGMTVTMNVSKGPTQVTIPGDIIGVPAQQAQAELQGLGLQVNVFGAGTVRNANPGPGSVVAPGSTVTLIAIP